MWSAKQGYYWLDKEAGERYLTLEDGQITEGGTEALDFGIIHFSRNDLRLPEPERRIKAVSLEARASSDIMRSARVEDIAEVQWRFSPAIAVIVLGMLAIPLSHSAPREGRGGRVILGILTYTIYANILYMWRSWIAEGDLPPVLGLWWVHLLVFIVALALAQAPGADGREGLNMVKLVDRYVGRAALMGMLAVWFVMTMLFILLTLLGELRDTQGDYGTGDVFWFIALTTPRMAYQIFPISALLGALVGVGGLAAANELVAFRTSGVSRTRLALAGIAGAMLLTVPVVIMGEWVAPAAEQQARAFRLSEMVGRAIIGGPSGVWMRDGKDIVNISFPCCPPSAESNRWSSRKS